MTHRAVLLSVITAISFVLSAHLTNARADDSKARNIMRRVEDRDEGDNRTAEMEMILIDKNKKQRVRKIDTYTKDQGPDTHRLMFFSEPADVSNRHAEK